MLIGVGQRQEGEKDVVAEAEFLEHMVSALHIGADIAVGEHHAFGLAAGAGRVDQTGEIVGAKRFGRIGLEIGARFAKLQGLVPAHRLDAGAVITFMSSMERMSLTLPALVIAGRSGFASLPLETATIDAPLLVRRWR